MARYSGATWHPLPQNSTQLHIHPVGVVLHTAVSNGSSLWTFFNGRSAGVESHFYVREDGTIEQYMDTGVRADCQLDGNSWLSGGTRYGFISIETWDGGHPETTPWNEKQLAGIVKLVTWAAKTHGFEAVKATGPQGHGIGYHQQFTDSASDPDPSWNHTHSCPGAPRIAQVPLIIARVAEALKPLPPAPVPAPTPKDDMPTAAEIAQAVWSFKIENRNDPATKTDVKQQAQSNLINQEATQDQMVHTLAGLVDGQARIVEALQGLYAKVDALAKKVDGGTA